MKITAPAKRLSTSQNGNPRYLVELDGQTYATVVDAQVGYVADNFRVGQEVTATFSLGQIRTLKDV